MLNLWNFEESYPNCVIILKTFEVNYLIIFDNSSYEINLDFNKKSITRLKKRTSSSWDWNSHIMNYWTAQCNPQRVAIAPENKKDMGLFKAKLKKMLDLNITLLETVPKVPLGELMKFIFKDEKEEKA